MSTKMEARNQRVRIVLVSFHLLTEQASAYFDGGFFDHSTPCIGTGGGVLGFPACYRVFEPVSVIRDYAGFVIECKRGYSDIPCLFFYRALFGIQPFFFGIAKYGEKREMRENCCTSWLDRSVDFGPWIYSVSASN